MLKSLSLLLLRVSLGLLMLIWGVDKILDPDHGARVAESFYLGLFGWRSLLPVLEGVQMLLGVLVILGLARRYTYPVLLAVTGVTLLGVWRSVVDPWGWYLEGATALFYPSLIIVAGVLVLMASREDDRLVLGEAGGGAEEPSVQRPHATASSTAR